MECSRFLIFTISAKKYCHKYHNNTFLAIKSKGEEVLRSDREPVLLFHLEYYRWNYSGKAIIIDELSVIERLMLVIRFMLDLCKTN